MGQHLLATGNVRGKKERGKKEREMKENEWKKEMKKNERELCLSHFPSQERRKRKN